MAFKLQMLFCTIILVAKGDAIFLVKLFGTKILSYYARIWCTLRTKLMQMKGIRLKLVPELYAISATKCN